MSDAVSISSNARDILQRFERLPSEVKTAVKAGLARGLLLVEEQVKRRADVRFSGARSGLASRLTSYVQVGHGPIAIDGIIGFRKTRGFPYELAQEFGARAKPGKAMAIPVSPEAKGLSQRGLSAKDFPRRLVRIGKTLVEPGVRWANQFGRDDGNGLRHYVLVKAIAPRLHFRENVVDNLDIVSNQVVQAWESR